MKFGPVEIKLIGSEGEQRYEVDLSDIPALFHKIPGATDILDTVFQSGINRYQLYGRMVARDTAANAAINKLAMFVERCYQGMILHPGEELTEEEKEFLKEVQKEADRLKFKKIFYAAARRICIDGDAIINLKRLAAGWRLDFLPMTKMTAIRQRGDLHKTNAEDDYYSGPARWYVYDEGNAAEHVYRATNIVHIPLNNMAEVVEDIIGRNTWGIWSHSPMESLRPEMYWKLSSVVNDMIWRKLYLPREHHEIDLTDMLDLEKYEGDTIDERRAAAMTAVAKAISEYIDQIKLQMPDQGYVTPKVGELSAVKITVIEPKSTTYVSPNQLLKQLSSNIASAYYVRLTSDTSASFAAEHIIASDTQVAAEYIAGLIKEELLGVLRERFASSAHVDKVDIRLQLILPKDVENLVRESAVLRASGTVLIDEIRVRWLGLDPLTTEQRETLATEMAMTSSGFAQSMDQIIRDFVRRKPDEEAGRSDREQTPESEHENQLT